MATRKAEVIFVGDASSIVRAALESKAAVDSLKKSADQNAASMNKLEAAGNKASNALGNLPQLGGNIASAAMAAAPAVMGLVGALGALTASAGAAAGGAGALGVGGMGALLVGFGSIATVAKPAMDNFKKVDTALKAYNTTLANHNTTAKAAQQAQSALNAVVSQNGGPAILNAVKAWESLSHTFQSLTGGARTTMFQGMTDGLNALKSLLPTVAGIANRSMSAFVAALQPVFKMLSGSQFKGILDSLGRTFARAIGPAVKAAADVFMGFANIAKAAGPYVVQFANSLAGLAGRFLDATSNSKKLGADIGILYSNFKSWMSLIGNVGKLIFDVFKQGVSSGQGMVNSMSGVLGKWDQWTKSAKGSQDIKNFFQQSAQFLKELFAALGPVVKAIGEMSAGPLPIYVKLMGDLKGIMGPLTYAFVAYKVALVAATVATTTITAAGKAWAALTVAWTTISKAAAAGMVAWAIATDGATIATKAATIAQIAFDAAMDANPIILVGTAIAALVAGVIYLATQTHVLQDIWAAMKSVFQSVTNWMKNATQDIVSAVSGAWNKIKSATTSVWDSIKSFLKQWWPLLLGVMTAGIGTVVVEIVRHWSDIKSTTASVWNTIKGALKDTWNAIKSTASSIWNTLGNVISAGWNAIKKATTDTWNAVKAFLKDTWNAISNTAGNVWGNIKSTIGGAVTGAFKLVQNGVNTMKGWLTGAWSQITKGVTSFANDVKTGVLNAFQGVINTVVGFVNDIIGVLNKIPGVNIGTVGKVNLTGGGSSGSSNGPSAGAVNKATGATPGRATGGTLVNHPMFVVGEEAPQHPEVVIATNPAYRKRNMGLWAEAGRRLGVPGFAKGGTTGGNVWAVRTSQEAAASGTGYTELSPNGNAAARLGIPRSFSNNPAHYPDFASLGKFYGQSAHSGGALPLKIRNGSRSGIWPMTDYGDGSSYAPAIGLTPAVTAVLGPAGGTMEITRADGGDLHLFPGMGTLVSGSGGFAAGGHGNSILSTIGNFLGGAAGAISGFVGKLISGGANAVMSLLPKASALPKWMVGTGEFVLKKVGGWVESKVSSILSSIVGGGGGDGAGSFTFQNFKGKLPIPVQKALQIATYEVGRHIPYGTGQYGAYYGVHAPSMDCSGFVSTVLNAAGLDPAGHLLTGGLKTWGEPGPGRYITVGVLGADSGPTGHTMMEIANRYFESGGGGGGPHEDRGWSSYFPWKRHPKGLAQGGMMQDKRPHGTRVGEPGYQPTLAEFVSDKKIGLAAMGGVLSNLPFVGSFAAGGVVGETGMAHVHKGETVLPNVPSSVRAILSTIMTRGQEVAAGLGNVLLYPLQAILTALQNFTVHSKTHTAEIARLNKQLNELHKQYLNIPSASATTAQEKSLTKQLDALKQERTNLPSTTGKNRLAVEKKRKEIDDQIAKIEAKITADRKSQSTSAEEKRKEIEKERLQIEQKIKALTNEDAKAKAAAQKQLATVTAQIQQLANYRAAIVSIRQSVKDLASQAAQAWAQIQTNKINATHDATVSAAQATHDATIAAINAGPGAQLAAMQAQDVQTQNQQQLDSLNQAITSDQFTIAHSAGQTKLDAQNQLKQDQQALTAFQRQQQEQQLQDQINTQTQAADQTLSIATKAADDKQQAALAGLTQQQADYQKFLDTEMAALTKNLQERKITYAQWAKQVNAILHQYGLTVSTDPNTENAVTAGPGPAAGGAKTTGSGPKISDPFKGKGKKKKHHRALGGPVEPGYVYTVGEQGPEDVVFGHSGTVMTAAQTRRRGGGDIHIHGDLNVPSHRAARALVDRLAYKAAIGVA